MQSYMDEFELVVNTCRRKANSKCFDCRNLVVRIFMGWNSSRVCNLLTGWSRSITFVLHAKACVPVMGGKGGRSWEGHPMAITMGAGRVKIIGFTGLYWGHKLGKNSSPVLFLMQQYVLVTFTLKGIFVMPVNAVWVTWIPKYHVCFIFQYSM